MTKQLHIAKLTYTNKLGTSHHIFAGIDGKTFTEVRQAPTINDYQDIADHMSGKAHHILPMRFTRAYLEAMGATFSIVK